MLVFLAVLRQNKCSEKIGHSAVDLPGKEYVTLPGKWGITVRKEEEGCTATNTWKLKNRVI